MSGRQAAEALCEAAAELRDAVASGEGQAIAAASERRELAFAAVQRLDPADLPEEVRALLRAAAGLDAEALSLAERQLGAIRGELDEVARAREVVRSLAPGPEQARFVSKRV